MITLRVSHRLRRAILCSLFVFAITAPALARAGQAFHCATYHCGLHSDGAYPNYVIGTLAHVGSNVELRQAYIWAKAHGYWKSLPNSPVPYLNDVKLVTIALPKSLAAYPVTVFVPRAEFAASLYVVGDLVRYAPHDAAHDSHWGCRRT